MSQGGALLFGRRTYEDLLGFWTAFDQPNPFTDVLSGARKFVVSRSAGTTAASRTPRCSSARPCETVAALQGERDRGLTILGQRRTDPRAARRAAASSTTRCRSTRSCSARARSCSPKTTRADLALTRSLTTTTGVIIAQYTVR